MVKHIVCVGAVYIDTILTVLKFPAEDEKVGATSIARRRGGNCANTLEVLSQLVFRGGNNDSDGSEAPTGEPQLHLIAALPNRESEDVSFIRKSLENVKMLNSCIFRPDFSDAAASYIIQNILKNTRTIVSYNPLPNVTKQEFVAAACQAYQMEAAAGGWYHFEGRTPQFVFQCIEYLRSDQQGFKISVECENPERAAMALVAHHADVVFYSRLMQSEGFADPIDFLKMMKAGTGHDALMCCTWGGQGATVLQKNRGREEEWAHVPSWGPDNGVPIIDTIGAGDTFIAGMLYALAWHEDWTLQQKLNFANEIAGRKVYQVGFAGLGAQMRPTLDALLA